MKNIKKFFKKYWWSLIVILILIFYFFPNKKPQLKTYTVKKQNIKEEITLSGKINALEKANLRFQTSGRLAWVGVKLGDKVKKYQTIASLDQRDLKNRLEKYLNNYTINRLNFDRSQEVNWNNQFDLSESIRKDTELLLKENQYNLNQTVLDVEYQNLMIEYANLFSPIDGIVTKIDVSTPNINITPAGAEFEIVNPNTLYFQASADQTEVIKLYENQKGEIIFDSYPDKKINGKITYIGFTPKTDESGTVYEIRISFDDKDFHLKMGMTGDISFTTKERKNVIVIPKAFIKKDKEGYFVNIQEKNNIRKQYIKTDEEIDGQVIVKEGIKEKDIVVDNSK